MKILVTIVRWLVGLLFIFSGIVKTIDPIGFSIKLEEYFSPSVFDIPFLQELALPMSVFFVIFEVILGVLLILGIWKRFTLLSLLVMIVFFTFLTFYSAYLNKVTDCGCFGDFLKLEPWHSFYKDVVLLILIIFLWVGRKYIQPLFVRNAAAWALVASLFICAYIAFQGIYKLPLKDFRAYAVGKNIPEGMKTAEELGLPKTEIKMVYHLKNSLNGQKVTLNEDDYLNDKSYWAAGSPWEVESTDERVINKGYEPPIHDFVIDCQEGGDMTYHYLVVPKLILIVTPVPVKASSEGLDRVSAFVENMKGKGYEIISVASDEVTVSDLQTCFMDATTLKTMIRSNPGIMLLQNGTVVGKYNWRDIPTAAEVEEAFN